MGMGMERGFEDEFATMEKEVDEDLMFEELRENNTDTLREQTTELLSDLKELPYYNCNENKLAKDLLRFLVSELKIDKELILSEVLR